MDILDLSNILTWRICRSTTSFKKQDILVWTGIWHPELSRIASLFKMSEVIYTKNPEEDEVLVNNNGNAQDGYAQNGSRNHYSEQERRTGSGCSGVGKLCGDRVNTKFSKTVIYKTLIIILALLLIVFISLYATERANRKQPPVETSCLQGWIMNKGMCYLFSATDETWSSSQSNCSSYGGSFVTIDTQEEREFVERKADTDYWINLQRESVEQPWKWPNGSLVDDRFQIGGEGLCAYLNDKVVSSTYCDQRRNWICRMPVLGAKREALL
ncbi:C-type lectin domain family 2 member D-like isoform X2 [Hemicordylus capensis]|uniref:C-type lectin domain family 2 member D-like isoform X2 n=1 Tax=Hemicordylus capensis TaxID=884348 RepID=UPI0023042CFB|nr:C-type lectin domain family 2 member D-like isoform X2 [Hemicordylus capensis]